MKRLLRKQYVRRATTVVETAVMAPLIVTAMFGMLEVGYAFMVKQTVTLAAREGARAGALPGGNMNDVQAAATAAMSAANLSGYSVTSNIDSCGPTDLEVWVEVSIPLNRASFTGSLLGGGSFDISARNSMRREGVDPTGPSGGIDPTP
ncbi:MAG TPA: TadE family protein [Phycisphaerae bacterium]|nr:TadE family protein [Phycisphaerae bacterium]